MSVVTILVALALLIAANALYVAAEFGAVSAPRGRIRALAEDGNARAQRLLPVVEQPAALDRYIAACQIGITLSSLVLGAYGQAQLAPVLERAFGELGGWETASAETAAFAIVLVGLSVAQMVLGELVPKAIALEFPERSALLTEPPMKLSLRAFAPLIWIFNGSGLAVLRLLGIRQTSHRHVHSPGEIDLLLAEGAGGTLEPEERRRLRRALRLSNTTARDVMVPRHRIVAVEVDTALDDAVRIATEAPYTRFPVYRGELDRIAGVLHTKDIVRAQMRGERGPLSELLRPAVSVGLDDTADELLVRLRERRAPQAIVVDSNGRVAGLVTLGDVLGVVFGALADEYKSGPRDDGAARKAGG